MCQRKFGVTVVQHTSYVGVQDMTCGRLCELNYTGLPFLQLRYQHGLTTPDLQQTLPNLKNFLEHGLMVRW